MKAEQDKLPTLNEAVEDLGNAEKAEEGIKKEIGETEKKSII